MIFHLALCFKKSFSHDSHKSGMSGKRIIDTNKYFQLIEQYKVESDASPALEIFSRDPDAQLENKIYRGKVNYLTWNFVMFPLTRVNERH